MTQAQKLEALVRKAIEGGWNEEPELDLEHIRDNGMCVMSFDYDDGHMSARAFRGFSVSDILFNHDFACALFGEEKREWLGKFSWYSLYEQDGDTFQNAQELIDSWVYQGGREKPAVSELEDLPVEGEKACGGIVEKLIETTNKGWQYHLQQAVISDDPISYLYDQVFGVVNETG